MLCFTKNRAYLFAPGLIRNWNNQNLHPKNPPSWGSTLRNRSLQVTNPSPPFQDIFRPPHRRFSPNAPTRFLPKETRPNLPKTPRGPHLGVPIHFSRHLCLLWTKAPEIDKIPLPQLCVLTKSAQIWTKLEWNGQPHKYPPYLQTRRKRKS